MNIEVGEYVRTKDGVIAKLEDIQDNEAFESAYWFDRVIYSSYSEAIDFLTTEELPKYIVSHSKNIIDLVEVGDYVNGYLINYIADDEKAIYHDALDFVDVQKFENKDIKSIVTKQQFSNMEYRL